MLHITDRNESNLGVMNTYTYESKRFGFQLSIPDGWSDSSLGLLTSLTDGNVNPWISSSEASDARTIVGPDGEFLNILITPLSEDTPEPTIDETDEYFDGLSYRQDLHVMATGTINVADKEHFWASYYRMSLFGSGTLQFYKKYCLLLNRVEYLVTAVLWSPSPGEGPPTGQMLEDVRLGIEGRVPISFYGRPGGVVPLPEEVLGEIRKIHSRSIASK